MHGRWRRDIRICRRPGDVLVRSARDGARWTQSALVPAPRAASSTPHGMVWRILCESASPAYRWTAWRLLPEQTPASRVVLLRQNEQAGGV
jgi:hypothetical protein